MGNVEKEAIYLVLRILETGLALILIRFALN